LHARIDAAGWSFRPASSAQVLQRPSSAYFWEASVICRPVKTLAASRGEMWAQDQVSMLKIFFSSKGIEDLG
jgi:hypothetical protein